MNDDMTVVERLIHAEPDRVFDMLGDGWLYPVWVVGATHIRDVDDTWPAAGARVHHQIGAWPVMVSDSTESLECDRPHRLRLRARAWPFGEAVVEVELSAEADGCRVRLGERPTRGPVYWLDNPLARLFLRARNRECLSRLAALAEHRGVPAPP